MNKTINEILRDLERISEEQKLLMPEDEIAELSRHRSALIRGECCYALLYCSRETAKTNLLILLRDSSWMVRSDAACCLDIFENDQEVCQTLYEAYLAEKNTIARGDIVYSLLSVARNDEKTVLAIESASDNEHYIYVRLNIYHGLYKYCNRDTLEQIAACFGSRRYQTRCAVLNTLTDIIDHSNAQTILNYLECFERRETDSPAVQSAIDGVKREAKRILA